MSDDRTCLCGLAARSAGSGSRVEHTPIEENPPVWCDEHRRWEARPTPPPSVDGTRCAVCGEVKDDVFHEPCLIGGRFHNVKTCHPFTPVPRNRCAGLTHDAARQRGASYMDKVTRRVTIGGSDK